jgi:hypothetical protein
MIMLVKILLGIAISIAIAWVILFVRQAKNSIEVNNIWNSLATQPANIVFSQDAIAELPSPVQRYFLHAIALGIPKGKFRTTRHARQFQTSDIRNTNI